MDVRDHADALEQLYRDRYAAFRNALSPIVGSREVAHDVVQEAFAQALSDISKLRSRDSLAPWVWQIASRIAFRERRKIKASSELDELTLISQDAERFPEVDAAIRALPPRRRMIVFLRYFADFSYGEIAEALDVSEGTVGASLAQAHAVLLSQLAEEVAP